MPEYLVDKTITTKVYYDYIIIYANHSYVCEHKKIDGMEETNIDILHYLNTFSKKPGAVKNSLALKSLPIFTTKLKEFINIIRKNQDKNLKDLIKILSTYNKHQKSIISTTHKNNKELDNTTRIQINKYNTICLKVGEDHGDK